MAEQIRIVTAEGSVAALHWYLTDREVMWQALKELMDAYEHRGCLQMWPGTDGEPVYHVEANDNLGRSAVCGIGDHLVLVSGGGLRAYDRDMYEAIALPEGE